jgi:type I restriction enzyme S subunit
MSAKVPEGWREEKLGHVVEIAGGIGFPESEQGKTGLPYPFVKVSDMNAPGNGTSLLHAKNYVDATTAKNLGARLFPKGAIALPKVGAAALTNKRRKIVQPTAVDNNIMVWIPRDFIYSEFLYYYSLTIDVGELVQVGALPSFNKKLAEAIPVFLPPLPEQRRIAEILSSVDEAIAATQAVIDQTRKVKQGVLKRLLTKGIGHTRFKKTEIGEIPEEWEVVVLPTLLREPVRNGYSPICPSIPTGKWILSLSALTHDGFSPDGVKPAPVDDPRLDNATLAVGDIIISRSNTPERVGLVGLYRGDPSPCYYPDLMMRLRVDQKRIYSEFAVAWLSFLQSRRYFTEAASGTSASMVKINRTTLADLVVPVPPLEEQREITDRISQISATEDHARGQAQCLHKIKSALMSDLLTGRKRVQTLTIAAE